jgi:hypothetical protein
MDICISYLQVSADANNPDFNQTFNQQGDYCYSWNFALLHEGILGKSHGTQLEARWQQPYFFRDIVRSLEIYLLVHLDGVERVG